MLSIRVTSSYLQQLQLMRPTCWQASPGRPLTPLMPWITPSVPPRLIDAMVTVGSMRHLHPGEFVFKPTDRYDRLVMLASGLGGRVFGSLFAQSSSALALAIPGRIIGGNHCFFSGRPAVGCYFAMTEADILSASAADLKSLMHEDPELAAKSAGFLDMCLQSDRIGLGAIALLPSKSRLLAWFLSWGFVYGELERDAEGGPVLRLSPVLPVDIIARVVSSNPSQLKRDIAGLKADGILRRDGHDYLVCAEALDPVWNWLRGIEEPEALLRREADWRVYFTPGRIDRQCRMRAILAAKSGK